MKLFLKILKWFLISVFSLVGVVIGLVLLVWFQPNLLLKDSLIKKILLEHQTFVVFPKGYPERLSLSMKNERLLSQVVELDISPFCADLPSVGVSLCGDTVHAETTLRLIRWGVGVERIGPIQIALKEFKLTPVQTPEKVEEEEKPSSFTFAFLPELKLKPIRLAIEQGIIKPGKDAIKFGGFIQFAESSNPANDLDFSTEWNAKLPFDPKSISLQGTGELTKTENLSLQVALSALPSDKAPGADLKLNGQVNLRSLHGSIKGKGDIVRLMPLLPKVSISEFTVVREKKISFDAKLDANLAVGEPISKKKRAMPAPVIITRAQASVHGEENDSGGFRLGFDLIPVKQHGMELGAQIRADLMDGALQLRETKISLDIPEFGETVRSLSKTQFAVIAPFNALRGKVALSVLDPDPAIAGVPFKFSTDLRSAKQRLITRAEGMIALSKTNVPSSAAGKFTLNEVVLEAPDLNPISPIPALGGDPRIITPSVQKPAPTIARPRPTPIAVRPPSEEKPDPVAKDAFPWSMDIESEKPITILYDLFKPAAPFQLKGRVSSSEPARFDINFQPMAIEYMKRRAEVDFLKVKFEKQLLADGRLSIKRTDCTIFATIKKTGDGTTFQLTSEPAFDEGDIVAMLLFNERASDLDDSSKRSVEDTRQAVSRKSLGFFSFFVLASTPVESVAYDPTTRVYSARVRLPGGFSATVGSDWDKTQEVGLMKRLGGKWILSVGTTTDADGGSAQTSMIEWWNRY